MRKRKKENYLDRVPKIDRELEWDEDQGYVVLKQEHRGFYSRLAQKFFHTPKVSKIRLDEFGSFVWLCIDGNRTIYEIGTMVSDHFGKDAEPLYDRLCKYFWTLNDEKFITFSRKENVK